MEVVGVRFQLLCKADHQVGNLIARIHSTQCGSVAQCGREQEVVPGIERDGGLVDVAVNRCHLHTVVLVRPFDTIGHVQGLMALLHHHLTVNRVEEDVIGTRLLHIPVVGVVHIVACVHPLAQQGFGDGHMVVVVGTQAVGVERSPILAVASQDSGKAEVAHSGEHDILQHVVTSFAVIFHRNTCVGSPLLGACVTNDIYMTDRVSGNQRDVNGNGAGVAVDGHGHIVGTGHIDTELLVVAIGIPVALIVTNLILIVNALVEVDVAGGPAVGAVTVVGQHSAVAHFPSVGEDAGIITYNIIGDGSVGCIIGTVNGSAAAIGVVVVTGLCGQVSGLGRAVLVEDDVDGRGVGGVGHMIISVAVDHLRCQARQCGAAPGCRQFALAVPCIQVHVADRLVALVAHIDVIGINLVGLYQRGNGGHIGAVEGEHHVVGAPGVNAEQGVVATFGIPRTVAAVHLVLIVGIGFQMNVACRPGIGAVVLSHQRLAADFPAVGEDVGILAHDKEVGLIGVG